jgi:hypothetical protein
VACDDLPRVYTNPLSKCGRRLPENRVNAKDQIDFAREIQYLRGLALPLHAQSESGSYEDKKRIYGPEYQGIGDGHGFLACLVSADQWRSEEHEQYGK